MDVRNRYQGTWVRGFEVAEVSPDGYRIRRMSDGSTLGELFSATTSAGSGRAKASGGTEAQSLPGLSTPSM